MSISSEIYPTDGLNFSDNFFYNGTEEDTMTAAITVDIFIVLLCFPINLYVIWLILKGTGNGLAAEFFFLNLTVYEIFFCIQCPLHLINYNDLNLWAVRYFFNTLGSMGCPLFQCLMCVERYLAVVHPVTFLKLKHIKYKVICSVIVWVVTFVFSGIIIGNVLVWDSIFIFSQFSLLLFIQLICLVAVLRALKQTGPGERARERKEKNYVKRRAFLIILVTTVTMVIKFLPSIILIYFAFRLLNTQTAMCIGYVCFTFAGLVQPLLFLNRVGKLTFIKCD